MTTDEADVVVVGSGGAALVAACAAADEGVEVAILERSAVLGGTTAVSGGMLWIGNNPLSGEIGIDDSREEALTYLDAVTLGEVPKERLEAFVDTGPELVRYLHSQTPVRLFPIDRPDYHAEWPGGKLGGRVLDNRPFDTSSHPGLAELVREGSHFPPLTYEERHHWRWPEHFDWNLITERMMGGVRTLGGALAAGLVAAARERGIRLVTGVRARELVAEGGRTVGVRCDVEEGARTWRARRAVVLASGGYEWNGDMTRSFLRGPAVTAVSPPWNVGDGLVMVLRAGGAVTNMSEAWWAPTYRIPGEEYEGRPMSRHIIDELSLPGSIVVNRAGQRFVSESVNYNDISKAFHVFDPGAYHYPNVPAWLVFDHRFKSRYAVATVMSSNDAPPWFHASDSIEELAGRIGIDATGLAETIQGFNRDAVRGIDTRFGRGQGALDRYYGDADHEPNPCLAPLTEPPYYAVEILPGLLGTKGGAVTDLEGRLVDFAGKVLPGLFACSNVAASSMGPGYPGAGGSLGPLLAAGLRCGRTAARG
jgi:3-oxosteroid 1-dehydrogenase